MHGTQPSPYGELIPRGMRVTLLGLTAANAGQLAGIVAGAAGGLTLYEAGGVGAGAAVAIFAGGMRVLHYLRQ